MLGGVLKEDETFAAGVLGVRPAGPGEARARVGGEALVGDGGPGPSRRLAAGVAIFAGLAERVELPASLLRIDCDRLRELTGLLPVR